MTHEDRKKLAAQKNVEIWQFKNQKLREDAKKTPVLTVQQVINMKVLLRKAFRELLHRLPEATDEQLRWLMLREHPAWDWAFCRRYSGHAQNATSRWITTTSFRHSLELARTVAVAKQKFPDNVEEARAYVADFMAHHAKSMYWSSRSFDQATSDTAMPVLECPEELQKLLAERRGRGEEPGKGLLERNNDEVRLAQREFMLAQREKDIEAKFPNTRALQPHELIDEN